MSALTPKRLAIALALSLAINLFGAGFLVARGLRARDGRGVTAMESPRALMGAARKAGVHEQARRIMREHRPELRSRRDSMRHARRRARGALTAPAFDAQEMDAALREMRARTNDTQAALHGALVQLATELTHEQRDALVGAIGRGHRRGKGKGKGKQRRDR